MIEIRIHHIDTNFPEPDPSMCVTVKFMDDTIGTQQESRDAAVTVSLHRSPLMTIEDVHTQAIEKAYDFLVEILNARSS